MNTPPIKQKQNHTITTLLIMSACVTLTMLTSKYNNMDIHSEIINLHTGLTEGILFKPDNEFLTWNKTRQAFYSIGVTLTLLCTITTIISTIYYTINIIKPQNEQPSQTNHKQRR